MRRKLRRLLDRITGFSTPFFGLSWTPKEAKKNLNDPESRAKAFTLGTLLITNINAVSEQARQNNRIKQLWESIRNLCDSLKIETPDIPGERKVISGDKALRLTMSIVQELRQVINDEHNREIAEAFWFGVVSMLAGQFCQNPELISQGQPLVNEVETLAKHFNIKEADTRPYIKSLNSKDPLLVQSSILPFVTSVSEKLAQSN